MDDPEIVLPGGQITYVFFLMALAHLRLEGDPGPGDRRKVLLLDEPLSKLPVDQLSQENRILLDTIAGFHRRGVTQVIVDHSGLIHRELGGRLLMMEKRRIVTDTRASPSSTSGPAPSGSGRSAASVVLALVLTALSGFSLPAQTPAAARNTPPIIAAQAADESVPVLSGGYYMDVSREPGYAGISFWPSVSLRHPWKGQMFDWSANGFARWHARKACGGVFISRRPG